MLNAINTKLLIAILAALTVAVIYQRDRAATAAAKAAAILQQQQTDVERQRERDEAFRKQVKSNRKQHNSAAAHEGKTCKSYLP
jgi:hypothetical protein